ncbi:S-adenosyl-L-methionine-dependent methyltransferase [Calycina marina]|uniref:Arginine N-methyltransferase 2 n=1 Tax=Calycina marina TaxID=1763456 RepID=A0A9P8CI57_9HELO|nr:S-adenosyl-L-methionine-dependent methyltransferase [Calycina marina]
MDDPAFSPEVDETTQLILLHASNHDLPALKPLLRVQGNATVQDPETGYTPLHAAIAACSYASSCEEADMEKAKATVQELFMGGAIWNDLDTSDETPGCMAWRLGRKELYQLCVEAGVRAEMLLGIMGGYEELDSEDEEEEEQGEEAEVNTETQPNGDSSGEVIIQAERKDVNSEDYLKSKLKFEDDKLLDADDNGVMMTWETDIMRRSVGLLLPDLKPGARILNIGFGMGIIDRMFRETKPLSHHIVEAHPAVLQKLFSPVSDFGSTWQSSAPACGKYVIHAGKWQDIVPKLLEEGEVYDAIYFDTFGEDYSQLKLFFSEYVVGLMDPEGRFGFFNGLGADRRVCYDVYCKVAELDLCDAGMDVNWTDVEVGTLGGDGEGEWKGVRRRYWTLDKYRLPVCTFLG